MKGSLTLIDDGLRKNHHSPHLDTRFANWHLVIDHSSDLHGPLWATESGPAITVDVMPAKFATVITFSHGLIRQTKPHGLH